MDVLKTLKLKDLFFHPKSPSKDTQPLSAASGLVAAGEFLHIVADDELSLVSFGLGGSSPGVATPLLPGALASGHATRKKQKPDFEALAFLPPQHLPPHGGLIAFASGSKPNRHQGVTIKLGPSGEPTTSVKQLDLSPLYIQLNREFSDLNIEGAAVLGADQLRLFQRGNAQSRENASIDITISELLAGCAFKPNSLKQIRHYDLGVWDGVPLSFTDAVALSDGTVVYTAVAEATNDTYSDGAISGSVIGLISPEGRLLKQWRLEGAIKIEGLAVSLTKSQLIQALMVSDADDRSVPAGLFKVIFKA